MEPMFRPARPASWDRQNRQGTVWNRPELELEPERLNQIPHGTETRWNRNGTGPTRTVAISRRGVRSFILILQVHGCCSTIMGRTRGDFVSRIIWLINRY